MTTVARCDLTPYRAVRAILLLLPLFISGCATVDLSFLFDEELRQYELQPAAGRTRAKVAVVDISGIITSETIGSFLVDADCTPEMVTAVLNQIEQDRHVKAVVLRIDSPGGEVTASDIIHQELVRFKARTGLPVYTAMMGLACSGGCYIAMAGDRVFAHPTTVTGSIGVIARFPKLTGLADKVGYHEVILQSGGMKSSSHPLVEMSPEMIAIYQKMIDEMYGRFLDVVVDARPAYADRAALAPVADGRIYTASQALELGLIDDIDYLPNVIRAVMRQAGLDDASVVTYIRGHAVDSNLYSQLRNAAPQINLVNLDLGALAPDGPGFFYLWKP